MKILITGGAGFIGKWVVEKLPTDTKIVIIDSLDEQVHKTLRDFAPEIKERALCIKDDIQNIEAHKALIEGTDVVIHLAAQTGTGQSMYEINKYIQHNVNGTAKVLELISTLENKPKRIILSSSRAVYGEGAYTNGINTYYPKGREPNNLKAGEWEIYGDKGIQLDSLKMREDQVCSPTSVYGLTKLWQEQLLQIYCETEKIDLVTLRFQNVYGPKQELGNPYTGIIGIFTNLILQENGVELFEDGLMTRDFVFVEDVAEAVCKCIFYPETLSEIINIGSGNATTLKDLVETIAHISGKKVPIKFSGRFRVGDIRHAVSDMSKYKRMLGDYQTTSLELGIRHYLNWYLKQNPVSKAELQASFSEMEQKGLLIQSTTKSH
jgi:dTDP-L-rhamnose 4-epimerase